MHNPVEVYKTNVELQEDAQFLLNQLHLLYPHHKINFALDDCDRILRIEGVQIITDHIICLLQKNGFYCEALE